MKISRCGMTAALTLVGLQLTAAPALSATNDPCNALIQDKHVVGVRIVANGFTGWLGGVTGQGEAREKGLQVSRLVGGGFKFEGQALFDGENAGTVSGTCKNRQIRFIRSGNGVRQSYSGFLHEKGRTETTHAVHPTQTCGGGGYACMAAQSQPVGQEMSGLFGPIVITDLKSKIIQEYGWCARMVSIEQVH